jgi:hypothetical protein
MAGVARVLLMKDFSAMMLSKEIAFWHRNRERFS